MKFWREDGIRFLDIFCQVVFIVQSFVYLTKNIVLGVVVDLNWIRKVLNYIKYSRFQTHTPRPKNGKLMINFAHSYIRTQKKNICSRTPQSRKCLTTTTMKITSTLYIRIQDAGNLIFLISLLDKHDWW